MESGALADGESLGQSPLQAGQRGSGDKGRDFCLQPQALRALRVASDEQSLTQAKVSATC